MNWFVLTMGEGVIAGPFSSRSEARAWLPIECPMTLSGKPAKTIRGYRAMGEGEFWEYPCESRTYYVATKEAAVRQGFDWAFVEKRENMGLLKTWLEWGRRSSNHLKSEAVTKGYLRIRGGRGEVARVAQGNLYADRLDDYERSALPGERDFYVRAASLSDGVYKFTVDSVGRTPRFSDPVRVDEYRLLNDLEDRTDVRSRANTGSPGVKGFAQRTAASGMAQQNRAAEARKLIDWLRR